MLKTSPIIKIRLSETLLVTVQIIQLNSILVRLTEKLSFVFGRWMCNLYNEYSGTMKKSRFIYISIYMYMYAEFYIHTYIYVHMFMYIKFHTFKKLWQDSANHKFLQISINKGQTWLKVLRNCVIYIINWALLAQTLPRANFLLSLASFDLSFSLAIARTPNFFFSRLNYAPRCRHLAYAKCTKRHTLGFYSGDLRKKVKPDLTT